MNCGGEFDEKGWKGGCPFGCGGSMFFPKHQRAGCEEETFNEWIERKNDEDLIRRKGKG
jgi:hypothetical protein